MFMFTLFDTHTYIFYIDDRFPLCFTGICNVIFDLAFDETVGGLKIHLNDNKYKYIKRKKKTNERGQSSKL